MNLARVKTYPEDVPLLKKLGLKSDINIYCHEETFLGNAQIRKIGDYKGSVDVYMEGCPAQFFKFVLKLETHYPDVYPRKEIAFETGSGCFSDYWKKLSPLFDDICEGMIVIKEAK